MILIRVEFIYCCMPFDYHGYKSGHLFYQKKGVWKSIIGKQERFKKGKKKNRKLETRTIFL